jgi:hypothetical protein
MSRPGRALALLAALFLTSMEGAALAHKPSDSYLKLDAEGATITGQWDIALRDLDFAIGLDSNQDNAITWGEVKAKHSEIAAYALSRLTLGPAGARCVPDIREHLIDNHSDGAYAVLRFTATCPVAPAVLDVDYRLFFDIDPQHRGLLNLSSHGANRAGIFSVDKPVQQFTLAEFSRSAQFADYLKEGVLHIWSGFDHILFLLSLLLPAVLVRRAASGKAWVASPGFRASLLGVLKIVTAFTVAHSITLSLATLGVVSLPSRLVESAIAASVVLAALNNIRPVVYGGRWIIAFCFGLIHGFGFASVLIDLGLPQGSLLLALVAFNLGVEVGQLVIVAFFLPLAYAARDTLFYRRAILVGGSSCVAMIAALWFVQRGLNVVLVPGLGS